MFETILEKILQRYLGEYVSGIDRKNLQLGVWEGHVVMKNLQLKKSALDFLKLPISMLSGEIRELEMQVPWRSLSTSPVHVRLKGVYILAKLIQVDSSSEDKRTKFIKKSKIQEAELLREIELQETLFNKIIANLRVTVENIHIRFQDTANLVRNPFTMGLTVSKMSVYTTDEEGNECFVIPKTRVHKVGKVEALACYWNSNADIKDSDDVSQIVKQMQTIFPEPEPEPQAEREQGHHSSCDSDGDSEGDSEGGSEGDSEVDDEEDDKECKEAEGKRQSVKPMRIDYLLHPLDATAKLLMQVALQDLSIPQHDCSLQLTNLNIHCSYQQLRDISEVTSTISRMRLHQQVHAAMTWSGSTAEAPLRPPKTLPPPPPQITHSIKLIQRWNSRMLTLRARQWWRYAITNVKLCNNANKPNGGGSGSGRGLRVDYNTFFDQKRQYVTLFRQKEASWLADLTEEEQEIVECIEERLPVESIMLFRRLARAEVDAEATERAKAYLWAGNFSLSESERMELYKSIDLGSTIQNSRLPFGFIKLRMKLTINQAGISLLDEKCAKIGSLRVSGSSLFCDAVGSKRVRLVLSDVLLVDHVVEKSLFPNLLYTNASATRGPSANASANASVESVSKEVLVIDVTRYTKDQNNRNQASDADTKGKDMKQGSGSGSGSGSRGDSKGVLKEELKSVSKREREGGLGNRRRLGLDLTIKMEQITIVYKPAWWCAVYRVLMGARLISTSTATPENSTRWSSWQAQRQADLLEQVAKRRSVKLQIKVKSPSLIFPCDELNKHTPLIVVDLGTFALNTLPYSHRRSLGSPIGPVSKARNKNQSLSAWVTEHKLSISEAFMKVVESLDDMESDGSVRVGGKSLDMVKRFTIDVDLLTCGKESAIDTSQMELSARLEEFVLDVSSSGLGTILRLQDMRKRILSSYERDVSKIRKSSPPKSYPYDHNTLKDDQHTKGINQTLTQPSPNPINPEAGNSKPSGKSRFMSKSRQANTSDSKGRGAGELVSSNENDIRDMEAYEFRMQMEREERGRSSQHRDILRGYIEVETLRVLVNVDDTHNVHTHTTNTVPIHSNKSKKIGFLITGATHSVVVHPLHSKNITRVHAVQAMDYDYPTHSAKHEFITSIPTHNLPKSNLPTHLRNSDPTQPPKPTKTELKQDLKVEKRASLEESKDLLVFSTDTTQPHSPSYQDVDVNISIECNFLNISWNPNTVQKLTSFYLKTISLSHIDAKLDPDPAPNSDPCHGPHRGEITSDSPESAQAIGPATSVLKKLPGVDLSLCLERFVLALNHPDVDEQVVSVEVVEVEFSHLTGIPAAMVCGPLDAKARGQTTTHSTLRVLDFTATYLNLHEGNGMPICSARHNYNPVPKEKSANANSTNDKQILTLTIARGLHMDHERWMKIDLLTQDLDIVWAQGMGTKIYSYWTDHMLAIVQVSARRAAEIKAGITQYANATAHEANVDFQMAINLTSLTTHVLKIASSPVPKPVPASTKTNPEAGPVPSRLSSQSKFDTLVVIEANGVGLAFSNSKADETQTRVTMKDLVVKDSSYPEESIQHFLASSQKQHFHQNHQHLPSTPNNLVTLTYYYFPNLPDGGMTETHQGVAERLRTDGNTYITIDMKHLALQWNPITVSILSVLLFGEDEKGQDNETLEEETKHHSEGSEKPEGQGDTKEDLNEHPANVDTMDIKSDLTISAEASESDCKGEVKDGKCSFFLQANLEKVEMALNKPGRPLARLTATNSHFLRRIFDRKFEFSGSLEAFSLDSLIPGVASGPNRDMLTVRASSSEQQFDPPPEAGDAKTKINADVDEDVDSKINAKKPIEFQSISITRSVAERRPKCGYDSKFTLEISDPVVLKYLHQPVMEVWDYLSQGILGSIFAYARDTMKKTHRMQHLHLFDLICDNALVILPAKPNLDEAIRVKLAHIRLWNELQENSFLRMGKRSLVEGLHWLGEHIMPRRDVFRTFASAVIKRTDSKANSMKKHAKKDPKTNAANSANSADSPSPDLGFRYSRSMCFNALEWEEGQEAQIITEVQLGCLKNAKPFSLATSSVLKLNLSKTYLVQLLRVLYLNLMAEELECNTASNTDADENSKLGDDGKGHSQREETVEYKYANPKYATLAGEIQISLNNMLLGVADENGPLAEVQADRVQWRYTWESDRSCNILAFKKPRITDKRPYVAPFRAFKKLVCPWADVLADSEVSKQRASASSSSFATPHGSPSPPIGGSDGAFIWQKRARRKESKAAKKARSEFVLEYIQTWNPKNVSDIQYTIKCTMNQPCGFLLLDLIAAIRRFLRPVTWGEGLGIDSKPNIDTETGEEKQQARTSMFVHVKGARIVLLSDLTSKESAAMVLSCSMNYIYRPGQLDAYSGGTVLQVFDTRVFTCDAKQLVIHELKMGSSYSFVSPFSFNLHMVDKLTQAKNAPSRGYYGPLKEIEREIDLVVDNVEVGMTYQNILIINQITVAMSKDHPKAPMDGAPRRASCRRGSLRDLRLLPSEDPQDVEEEQLNLLRRNEGARFRSRSSNKLKNLSNSQPNIDRRRSYKPRTISPMITGHHNQNRAPSLSYSIDINGPRRNSAEIREALAPSIVYRNVKVASDGIFLVLMDDRSGHRIPLAKAEISKFWVRGGAMGEMGDEQEMKAQVDVAGEYYDRRQVAWTPMLPRLKAIVRIKRQSGTPPVISINIQLQEPIKLRLESQLVATLVSLVDILTSDARAQVIPETRKFHRRIIRNQTGRDIWFWSSGVDPICVKHDQEAPVEDPQLIARSDSNILMKRSTSILEKHSRACQVSLQVSGYMPIEKITLHGVSRTLLSLTPSTQSHSKTSLLMDVCPHHGSHLVTLKPTLSIRNKTSAFLVLRMQRVASPSVYFDLLIEPTKTARVPLEFSDWDILHVAIRAKPGKRGRAKTPTLPSSPGRKDRWGKRSRSTSRVSDWGKRSRSRSPSTIKRKGGDPSSSNESTRDKPTKAPVYRWLKPEIRWDNLAKEAQRHETRSLPFYLTTGTFFDRKNGKDKSTSNTQMSTTKIASANMECTLRATIKYAALSTLEKRSVPGKAKKEEMWATPTDLILESAFRIRNQCPRTLEAKIRLSDRSKGPSKVDKVIKVGSSSYKDVVNLVFSPHVAISLRLPPYRWSSWIPIDAFTSGEVLKLDKSRTKRFNFPKFIKEDRDHEKEKVKRMLWYVESEGQVASPRRSRSPRSSPGNNSATGGRFTAGLVSVDQKVNSHGQSQLIISTEYRLNNRTQFHAQWVRFISGYQIQMLLHNNQWGQTEDIDMLLPSRCWRWEGGTTAEPEWSYAKSRNAFSWKSKVFRGARYRRRPIRRLCSLVGLGADESKESAEERAWHRGADGTLPRALHTSLPVQKWHYVSLRLIPIAGSNDRKRNFSPLRMIGPTKISDPLDLKRAIGDGLVRLQCRMQVRDRPAGKTKEDTQRIIRGYLDIVVSVRAGQGYLSLTKKLNVSIRTMVNSKAFGALVQLRQRDSPMLSYPWLANGDEVPMYWIEPNEPQHVCLVVHEQGTDRVFQSQAFALDQVGDKILRVHNGVDLRVMRICVGESDGVMEVSIEYEPVDEPLYVIENNTPHVMQVRQNIKQRMMDKMRRERSRERKQGCGNWYGAWTWILPRQRVVWGWDDLLQPQPYKLDIMLGDTKKVVTMDNIGWSNVMKLKVKKQNKVNLSVIARGVSKVMLAQLADMPWHAVGSVKGTCKMDLRLGIDVGELSIVLGSQNSGLLAELLLEDMHISHHLERWSSGSTRETLNVQLGYLQMLDLDPRAVFPAPLKSPGKPKDRMGNRKRKNEICLRFDSAWSRNQTDRIVFENLVTRFSRDSFTINLDEGFLSRVIAYAQALYSFRKNLTPSVSDGGDGPSQTSIIHLHRMSISRLLMELTFIANSEVQESELLENPVLKMIAAVFANLRNASMIMTALEVNNATLTLTRLHMLVKDHYSGLVRAQIVSLVGSSAVLGNPLGLIKNIGTGVTDFFSKPLLAIKDNNIKDVPISLIEGTGSLVGNIVSGVGSSASGITDTIGRGMAVLSLDKEHQRRRAKDMKRNQPKEIVSGVFMGVGKVVEGVVRGVSGLVIDPVQETKKHGVAGFFKGVGKGILGVVTKPVGGAMDGVAKITQGVANTGKILRIEDKRRDNWHRQRAEEVRRTWEAHDGVDAPLPVFHETIAARGYMSLFGSNTGIRCPYVNIAFIDRFGRRWCVTHHNRLQDPLGVSHSDPSVDEQKFSIEYQDFQDLSSLQAKGTLHNSSRDIDEKKATRGGWVAISAYGTKSYIAVNARGFLVLAKKDKGGRLDSRFLFQIENLVPGFSSTTIREGRMGQLIHIEKAAKSTHLRAKPSSGVYAGNTFQLTLGSGSFVAFRNPFYKSVLTLDKIEASGSMNPKGNEKSAKLGMVRYPSGLKQTFKVVDWKQARSKESTFFPMPTMSFGRRWMPDQGVIRATYGWESKRVDVTAMITKLVSPDGHLKIPSSFDCTANFGVDPARGKPKELVVDYRRGLVTNRWTLPQKIRHKARMFVGKTARPSDILTRGVHLQWSIEAANVDGRAGFLVRSALNGACLSVGEDGAEVYVSDESEASGKSMSIGKEHLFQLIAAYPESKESITESDIKAAVNLIPLPPKRFPPTPKKTPSAPRSAVPRAPSGPSAPRGAAPAPPGPQGIPPGPPSSKPPLPFRRDMSKSARF